VLGLSSQSADELSDYSNSYLWQWLRGDGSDISGQLRSYRDIEEPFLQLNRLGVEAINYKSVADLDTALRTLQNMESSSDKLMLILSKLGQELNAV
jgi:hypothetical protein